MNLIPDIQLWISIWRPSTSRYFSVLQSIFCSKCCLLEEFCRTFWLRKRQKHERMCFVLEKFFTFAEPGRGASPRLPVSSMFVSKRTSCREEAETPELWGVCGFLLLLCFCRFKATQGPKQTLKLSFAFRLIGFEIILEVFAESVSLAGKLWEINSRSEQGRKSSLDAGSRETSRPSALSVGVHRISDFPLVMKASSRLWVNFPQRNVLVFLNGQANASLWV